MSSSTTARAAGKSKYAKIAGAAAVAALLVAGVFASNGWFPRTDAFSGKRYGWFGRELPAHATNAWNPVVPPSPTPQLSKEYIYAGSRLLAVEDANAQAAPPADIAVWRPSSGVWHVLGQAGSQATAVAWGMSGDIPVPGDYDADGKTDFAIWRPSDGSWWVALSAGGSAGTQWGASGDLPAQADYDGDGKTDFAVYRPSTAHWYIVFSGGAAPATVQFGSAGSADIPGAADFTGDGLADLGVYRPSDGNYYYYDLSDGQWGWHPMGVTGISCIGGAPVNCVVPSDYDGDGEADPAVYDSSGAAWTIRPSTTGTVASTVWGASGDLPVPNDYDGDGRTDLAVFNNAAPAWWTIRRSSDGSTRTDQFGTTGDIPVPAWYRR